MTQVVPAVHRANHAVAVQKKFMLFEDDGWRQASAGGVRGRMPPAFEEAGQGAALAAAAGNLASCFGLEAAGGGATEEFAPTFCIPPLDLHVVHILHFPSLPSLF